MGVPPGLLVTARFHLFLRKQASVAMFGWLRRRRGVSDKPSNPEKIVVSTYGCRPGSQIQLDSDLDHLLDRDREMVGRAARVACQEREQRLGQPSHVPMPGGDQGLASDDVRDLARVPNDSVFGQRRCQRRRHARHLHEAVVQNHPHQPASQLFDGRSAGIGHKGNVFSHHGQQDDVLVNHVKPLHQAHQGRRHTGRAVGKHDCCARESRGIFRDQVVNEGSHGDRLLAYRIGQVAASDAPGKHDPREGCAHQAGEVATVEELEAIGQYEGDVERKEE